MNSSEAVDIVVETYSQLIDLPPEINTLHLDFCVGDNHLKYLLGRGIKINHLITPRDINNGITYRGFIYLSTINTNSITMNAHNITDRELKYFGNFDYVKLYDAYNITNFGLRYLSGAKTVVLINPRQITSHGLKYLAFVQNLKINNVELSDLITLGKEEIYLCRGYPLKNNDYKYFSCASIVRLDTTTLTSQLMRSLSHCHNIHLINCRGYIHSVYKYLIQTQNIYFYNCRPTSFSYMSMTGIKNIHNYSSCDNKSFNRISYLKSFNVNVIFYDMSDYKF